MRRSIWLTVFVLIPALVAAGAYLLIRDRQLPQAIASPNPTPTPTAAATPGPLVTADAVDPSILQVPSPTPLPGEPQQAPFVVLMNKVLEKRPLAVDCTKAREQDKDTALDAAHLWTDSNNGLRSVSYNDAEATVTVCHEGKGVAARLPGDSAQRLFDVGHANLRDFDGDGNDEFFAFDAKCAGACHGQWVLFRVVGEQIESLATIAAERITVLNTAPPLVKVVKACPAVGLDAVIDSFGVIQFSPHDPPRLIPEQRLARLPEPVLDALPPLSPDDQQNPARVAIWKFQALLNKAYTGVPIAQLEAEYQQIASTYAESASAVMGRKATPLKLACDFPKLLSEIANSR